MTEKQKKEETKQEENSGDNAKSEKRKGIPEAFDFRKLKKENFLVFLLIGVLLLIIGMPSSDEKKQERGKQSGITDSENAILNITGKSKEKESISGMQHLTATEDAGFFGKEESLAESYTEELEQALTDILSAMEGAGRVKVMITLKSSAEAIVEKDMTEQTNGITEVDSEGGSRNTTDISKIGETIYENGEDGLSIPYVRQVLAPGIEGVLVCAEGGGDKNVNKNITEAIQALFGIDVHKIKVIKMSSRIKGEAD